MFRPTTWQFHILIFYLLVEILVPQRNRGPECRVGSITTLVGIFRAEGHGERMRRIHFSCSISLRQIQFAFRRFRGGLHPARFGRSRLLLGESGENSFHGTLVDPDFLLQMLGAFCSKACGVQGARVDSKSRYRALQRGSNVSV